MVYERDGHDTISVRVPHVIECTECSYVSSALMLRNVPVFDHHGCIVGIDAEVRMLLCEHVVQGAEADPVAIAEMMNEVASR